jgi:hypothetical protein
MLFVAFSEPAALKDAIRCQGDGENSGYAAQPQYDFDLWFHSLSSISYAGSILYLTIVRLKSQVMGIRLGMPYYGRWCGSFSKES